MEALIVLAGLGLAVFVAHMRAMLDRNRRASQSLFDAQGRKRLP